MMIKFGDQGPDVLKIQQRLDVKEDGRWGYKTTQAVERFQLLNGLIVDGVVGPLTWEMLFPPVLGNIEYERKIFGAIKPYMNVIEFDGVGSNPRIDEMFQRIVHKDWKDDVPWCAVFANCVLEDAGYEGTGSALARSFLDWGKPASTHQRGAIVVIRTHNVTKITSTGYHVGFLESVMKDRISLIGGNQSNRVKPSWFDLTYWAIKGIRIPSSVGGA